MATPLSPQSANVAPPVKSATLTKSKQPQSPPQSTGTVKSKKDGSKILAPEPNHDSHNQMKKITRRSSRPIINWFQRKLAGTVRARRPSEPQRYNAASQPPRAKTDKQHRRLSVPSSPTPAIQARARASTHSRRHSAVPSTGRATLLDETDEDRSNYNSDEDSDGQVRSSPTGDSTYSPASYADEDASVRPLPPSSPPSPSPSMSSSSYLSSSRTFKSMTASTKPTTLLSIDLTGGMAHIAQAPPTPTTPGHRIPPHLRTHSGAGSITFSSIPVPSPNNTSRPSSGSAAPGGTLQAPQHTKHHPRNNPRPSSPPLDDASVLTLASSAYAMPGTRVSPGPLALWGRGSIADDSISQWSNAMAATDSTSHFMLGDLDEAGTYHDVDASVRALRPRSSRRGSWESGASKWSASAPVASASPTGARHRGLWTSGSFRTGELTVETEAAEREAEQEDSEEQSADADVTATAESEVIAPSTTVPSEESAEDVKTPVVPADTASTIESIQPLALPAHDAEPIPSTKSVKSLELQSNDHAPSGMSTPKTGVSTPVDLATLPAAIKDNHADANKEEGSAADLAAEPPSAVQPAAN